MDDVNRFTHYIPYLSLLVFSTTLLVNSYIFILNYCLQASAKNPLYEAL